MPLWGGCAVASCAQRIAERLKIKSMEGFLAGHPRSCIDYIISLHCIPFTGAIASALALHFCGAVPVWPILAIFAGGIASSIWFVLLPLPILGPIGGRHHVGLVHLDSCHSQRTPPVAVFYPTNVCPTQRGISYVPFGDTRFLQGMSTHAKVPLYFLKGTLFVRLRVSQGAPPIPLLSDEGGTPPPVIIFSHGLAAHYRLYSCLMMDLAARGAVVVSIGHCDGSASFTRDSGCEGNAVPYKLLGYEVSVREAQLAQRVQEVRQTLKRIDRKDFWMELGFVEADVERYFARPLQVHLSGHSFGGATALAAALQANQGTEGICVQSVFVFDPWVLPLQNEQFLQPIVEGRKKYMTPTLMIQSDDWMKERDICEFFQRATAAVLAQPSLASLDERKARDMFVTERTGGTSHRSVSDICTLSPIIHGRMHATVPPRAQIVEWSNALLRFVRQHTH